MRIHKRRGFTLVELLITVAVIVILIGIAILGYKNFVLSSSEKRMAQEITNLRKALELYYQKFNKMPDGSKRYIALCLIDSDDCSRGDWPAQRIDSTILTELKKVGYGERPSSFIDGRWYKHGEQLYIAYYDYQLSTDDWERYTGLKASAPFVQFHADGAFHYLYFLQFKYGGNPSYYCGSGHLLYLQPKERPYHYYNNLNYESMRACASHEDGSVYDSRPIPLPRDLQKN